MFEGHRTKVDFSHLFLFPDSSNILWLFLIFFSFLQFFQYFKIFSIFSISFDFIPYSPNLCDFLNFYLWFYPRFQFSWNLFWFFFDFSNCIYVPFFWKFIQNLKICLFFIVFIFFQFLFCILIFISLIILFYSLFFYLTSYFSNHHFNFFPLFQYLFPVLFFFSFFKFPRFIFFVRKSIWQALLVLVFIIHIYIFLSIFFSFYLLFNNIRWTDWFIVIIVGVRNRSVILQEISVHLSSPAYLPKFSVVYTLRLPSICAINFFELYSWAFLQPETCIHSSFVIINM